MTTYGPESVPVCGQEERDQRCVKMRLGFKVWTYEVKLDVIQGFALGKVIIIRGSEKTELEAPHDSFCSTKTDILA